MARLFNDVLSQSELLTLASIVQVGNIAYQELMETERPMFSHPYLWDMRGRLRTKLVQMQCEIESHDPEFPFEFAQRNFEFSHIIPELRTNNVILHIGRSASPNQLPYSSGYKVKLSYNNNPLQRQMIIDLENLPPYREEPFYALLTFGGNHNQAFSVIQFPEPGYIGIAEQIFIPKLNFTGQSEKVFERKKAVLKEEFLSHVEEAIS